MSAHSDSHAREPTHSDPDRGRTIDDLFAAHDDTGGIFDRPALDIARPLIARPPIEHVGPYRVLRELGRGGMGVVCLGERDDGQYRRLVAIKLLRVGPDPEELERRFVAERQILASLNHPNIAQLLDGGVTEKHVPFLVMEYVDGVPITTYCDRQRLGVEDRLLLFREVCSAVQHAHQNLILHRDIKPGNILVTEDRRVKLLDFGIAKLLNPMLGPADQPITRTEWRVMTPEYASPEQVRGDSLTTASDVYSLGILLYELLCGRRTHRITSGSPQELAEVIVQRDPLLPSVAVSRPESSRSTTTGRTDATPETVAGDRGLSVERLQRRLHGDLDAIVMMALRKETASRYASADALWEDVQRHLDGLPVLAHHPTRWYRARKLVGRHRLEATAAALMALSLIAGGSIAVRQAAVARRERDRAEQALSQSSEATEFLVRLFRTPAPAGATRDAVTARDMLATGMTRIEDLRRQPLVQAQMVDALGRVHEQLGRFDDAERMLRRALQLRRAQYGDNHADVATTLRHLSAVVRQRGRAADAMQLSREALAIQRRVFGSSHPEVARTLSDIAILLGDDDLVAAESLYREARDVERATLGPNDPQIAATDISLAGIRERRGAYDEAESLLREGLAINERAWGEDHGSTATSMVYLANFILSYRDQPAVAESLFNRATTILRHQPPTWLPHLLGALSGLVGVSVNRGDYVSAERYAREMLDTQRRLFGDDHPMVTEGMGLVAEQLTAQRRYAEADSVLGDAMVMLERSVGPAHARVGMMLMSRGKVRSAAGRYADAEADLRRGLAIMEQSEGPTSRWVAAISAMLGDVAARRGRQADADTLFDRAARILRPMPLQPEDLFHAVYVALVSHYEAIHRPADADHFRRFVRPRSRRPA